MRHLTDLHFKRKGYRSWSLTQRPAAGTCHFTSEQRCLLSAPQQRFLSLSSYSQELPPVQSQLPKLQAPGWRLSGSQALGSHRSIHLRLYLLVCTSLRAAEANRGAPQGPAVPCPPSSFSSLTFVLTRGGSGRSHCHEQVQV